MNDRDKVIAYHRWGFGGPPDDVVVVANFANRGYSDYRAPMRRSGSGRIRW